MNRHMSWHIHRRRICSFVALMGIGLSAAPSRASSCDPMLASVRKGSPPTREELAQCLDPDPVLAVSLGAGLTLFQPSLFDLFATIDVEALKPLWISVRGRYNTISQVDLMVGYRFAGDYGLGGDSWISSVMALGNGYDQVETTTSLTVLRSDWIVAAGIKGVFGPGGPDIGKTYELGLQWAGRAASVAIAASRATWSSETAASEPRSRTTTGSRRPAGWCSGWSWATCRTATSTRAPPSCTGRSLISAGPSTSEVRRERIGPGQGR